MANHCEENVPEVSPADLRPSCNPAIYDFETTKDLAPFVGLIGQDRAIEALKFGLGIKSKGFNIVVSGEPGTGRTTAILDYVNAVAALAPVPDDWVYVHNFRDPHRPNAIRFPPGQGRDFCAAMSRMVAGASERVQQTFTSDDFVSRRDEIVSGVQRHRDALFSQLAAQARTGGFLLQGNPSGFFLVPLKDNQPLDDQAFAALPEAERSDILSRRELLMAELRAALKEAEGLEVQAMARLTGLQADISKLIVESLLDTVRDGFAHTPEVDAYLSAVAEDMIENIEQFQPQPPPPQMPGFPPARELGLRKYEVNLLVHHARPDHAPVIHENNPAPGHLLGRLEKEALFGALMTDFTMIRPGSLHKANGGYLIVSLDELLLNQVSWTGLKRVIRTGELAIEELGERLGFLETKTVRPEPIPWDGKVIVLAREETYRLLYAFDPDFRELFKVKADFDMHIPRTPEHQQAYAALIAAITAREGLPPLDGPAVARVVEEGSRLAEDQRKLSIRFGDLMDIVREASYWAGLSGESIVRVNHIQRAVRERIYRTNLIEQHVREAVERKIIVVDTDGAEVGQVNGLSVVDLGDAVFGQPSRITATTGVGREGIIDLQREARLAGPVHTKAVMTLHGFLVDRYAAERPLTLAARMSFEQSYGMVEGDSATCAETCALLSRLSGVPIKQSLAITGSMDQRGDVQAIGGVNHKIEGFFDVCRTRGLTGEQGVIIPASNIQHLVLREDVVEAVKQGSFKVLSISTIDQALEVLTGVPAGDKREDGSYPPDSINGLVMARLRTISDRLREHPVEPSALAPSPDGTQLADVAKGVAP